MSATIAVIGCGTIGARHVQAMAGLDRDARILIVDPDESARRRAAGYFAEDAPSGRRIEIEELQAIDALPGAIDVAVVATLAAIRRAAIEQLLSRAKPRHLILEKFLFQRDEDYTAVAALLERAGAAAWVNCPRRIWPSYRDLRERLKGAGPIDVRVSAPSRFGIGTSAIHFLDIAAFLSGTVNFELRGDRLDRDLIENPRGGVEFSGTLYGAGANGEGFGFTAYAGGAAPPLVFLDSARLRIIADEGRQQAWISAEEDGWNWRDIPFPTLPQSRMTHLVVKDLLDHGTCGLAPYSESAALHRAVLRPLLEHYRKVAEPGADACPIT